MSDIKLITVCSHSEHASTLIASANKQGWDLTVIELNPWKGFGGKLIETYNYLKSHPEVERFVFADAFDVVVLGTPYEFDGKLDGRRDKLVCSAERGLWPPTLIPFRHHYYTHVHGFNYINSGLYYCPSSHFKYLFEKYPPFYEIDDQIWLNMCWLLLDKSLYGASIVVDTEQELFNSHSFVGENEYGYENNRIQILGNQSLFVHFNGKSVDEKFNERIKI